MRLSQPGNTYYACAIIYTLPDHSQKSYSIYIVLMFFWLIRMCLIKVCFFFGVLCLPYFRSKGHSSVWYRLVFGHEFILKNEIFCFKCTMFMKLFKPILGAPRCIVFKCHNGHGLAPSFFLHWTNFPPFSSFLIILKDIQSIAKILKSYLKRLTIIMDDIHITSVIWCSIWCFCFYFIWKEALVTTVSRRRPVPPGKTIC